MVIIRTEIMFKQIDSCDPLLILKSNRPTQETGFCRCICKRKLRSSISYNGCKRHLGVKMCINFHMLKYQGFKQINFLNYLSKKQWRTILNIHYLLVIFFLKISVKWNLFFLIKDLNKTFCISKLLPNMLNQLCLALESKKERVRIRRKLWLEIVFSQRI